MQQVSLDEVAAAWCDYHARGVTADGDADWWAVEFWYVISERGGGDRALRRKVIEALLRRAGDDVSLCMSIGAGPLEDYLEGGAEDIAWLERLALRLPGTRVAVGCMYLSGLDASDAAQLDQVARGPNSPRPSPSDFAPGLLSPAWRSVQGTSEGVHLTRELEREVPPGHVLKGAEMTAVAVRVFTAEPRLDRSAEAIGTDPAITERKPRRAIYWVPSLSCWALVDLNWATYAESDRQLPSTALLHDWDAVIRELSDRPTPAP